jgi:hypothetical protein
MGDEMGRWGEGEPGPARWRSGEESSEIEQVRGLGR